jgi:predicted  nucleic acid-binding Zn-ribbon protein
MPSSTRTAETLIAEARRKLSQPDPAYSAEPLDLEEARALLDALDAAESKIESLEDALQYGDDY